MTRFIVFSGRSTLLEIPLDTSQARPSSFEVKETDCIGFKVDDYDERKTYEIKVGDISIAKPQEHLSRLEWPASSYLDGASGVTPIGLRDASNGDGLARARAPVEPSKFSQNAYDAMFEDTRRIGVE